MVISLPPFASRSGKPGTPALRQGAGISCSEINIYFFHFHVMIYLFMEKRTVTFRVDPQVHDDAKALVLCLDIKLGAFIEAGMKRLLIEYGRKAATSKTAKRTKTK